MPIIACIIISAMVYIVLNQYFKEIKEEKSDYVLCDACKKEIQSNWRYCPYCGNTGKR